MTGETIADCVSGYTIGRSPIGNEREASMAYLLDQPVYDETVQLIRGEIHKSEILVRLANWLKAHYGISLLNFQFSKPVERLPYRLSLIVGKTEDHDMLFPIRYSESEELLDQIAAEFRRLALELKYAPESRLEGLWVRANDFSREAKTAATTLALPEAQESITARYPMVWCIEAYSYVAVVFYMTDADVARYEQDGTSRAVADAYYAILKKHDGLSYFTRENVGLRFDSKENLDTHYEGNLYYYFK